jgi:hypothetical protein
MKIKQQDFNELKEQLEIIIRELIRSRLNIKNNNHDERLRWNALYCIPVEIRTPLIDRIYTYANDDHISTALKKIFNKFTG